VSLPADTTAADAAATRAKELEEELRQAHATIADYGKAQKLTVDDYNYALSRYHDASNRAVEEARLNNDLRVQLKVAKDQVDHGLKQRHVYFEEIAESYKRETMQLRAANDLLLAQARLTDDSIRHKAAQYPRIRSQVKDLQSDLEVAQMKCSSLENRNEKLMDQLEVWRAKAMGVLDQADDDANSIQSDEAQPKGGSGKNATLDESLYPLAEAEDEELKVGEVVEGGAQFWCKWGIGEDTCPVSADNREVRVGETGGVQSLTRAA
jgi:hypothetical protein